MTEHHNIRGTNGRVASNDEPHASEQAEPDERVEPGTAGRRAGSAAEGAGTRGASGRDDELAAGGGLAGTDGLAGDVLDSLRQGPVGTGADLDALVAAAVRRAAAADLVDVAWTVTDTPVGPLTLAATDVGVVQIAFGDDEQVLENLAAEVSPRVLHLPARLDDVRRQLDEYFARRRRVFDLRLDRRLSHGYRRRVLETLAAEVGYGQIATYKELAERTGNPRASRAVGTAMATNPIPIVVPCHRVLRTGGALGGYGGGLETKAWLLELEGAPPLRPRPT
jgi:methylated-DNA-[protein]-cysteine S-methyltransferase